MNRTPVAGAPARAVVSYWLSVKFHSNVLPTSSGGNNAATPLTLISGRSLPNIRAPSMRSAYGRNLSDCRSGFVEPASARARSGAAPVVVTAGEIADKLCNGAALNTEPSAASSAAVAAGSAGDLGATAFSLHAAEKTASASTPPRSNRILPPEEKEGQSEFCMRCDRGRCDPTHGEYG